MDRASDLGWDAHDRLARGSEIRHVEKTVEARRYCPRILLGVITYRFDTIGEFLDGKAPQKGRARAEEVAVEWIL